MQSQQFVTFVVPFIFGTVILSVIISIIRNLNAYRLNDLLTNLSLSLTSSASSLFIISITLSFYSYTYEQYALFDIEQTSPVAWIIAFLLYDFLYYWAHRIHHDVSILWGSHIVHHSGEDMNLSLAVRQSSFGELTMWPLFLILAVTGISLELYLVMNLIQLAYQYFIHTKVIPRLGIIEKFFMTPALHRVHHARNLKYIDKNHGNILVIWDRIFGTYQSELPENPVVFGVRESIQSFSPITLNLQYYRTIKRKLSYCSSLSEQIGCLIKPPAWLPERAIIEGFYSETCKISSKEFHKYNPHVSNKIKILCCFRFILPFSLFLLFMWYFSTLLWWQIFNLFLGFFWLFHYNGKILDGMKIHWSNEALSQICIITSAFSLSYLIHSSIIYIAFIILSSVSLVTYILIKRNSLYTGISINYKESFCE